MAIASTDLDALACAALAERTHDAEELERLTAMIRVGNGTALAAVPSGSIPSSSRWRWSHCAFGVESAMQAADIGAKEKDGLQQLIKKAGGRSKAIREFEPTLLDNFRDTRNQIVHHEFSPQDDSLTTSLYLEVGLPFLSLCYREFHSFDLMDALLTEYVEHIHAAQRVHALAKSLHDIDVSYCLHGFAHLIRWHLKNNFSTTWEIDALVRAEEIGVKFNKIYDQKQDLERHFEAA